MTPRILIESEISIVEPEMVGELTVRKLCSRWRVPNRMESAGLAAV